VAEQLAEERTKKAYLSEKGLNALANADASLESRIKHAKKQKVSGPVPNLTTVNENRASEAVIEQIQNKYRYAHAVDQITEPDSLYQNQNLEKPSVNERESNSDSEGPYDQGLSDFYKGKF
jgi:hypothetical protein